MTMLYTVKETKAKKWLTEIPLCVLCSLGKTRSTFYANRLNQYFYRLTANQATPPNLEIGKE